MATFDIQNPSRGRVMDMDTMEQASRRDAPMALDYSAELLRDKPPQMMRGADAERLAKAEHGSTTSMVFDLEIDEALNRVPMALDENVVPSGRIRKAPTAKQLAREKELDQQAVENCFTNDNDQELGA